MHWRRSGIFIYCFIRNLLLSLPVKIGWHLAKLEAKVEWHRFSRHGEDVYYLATRMVGALADRFRDRHNQQSAMMSSCAYIELQVYWTYLIDPLNFNIMRFDCKVARHAVSKLQQSNTVTDNTASSISSTQTNVAHGHKYSAIWHHRCRNLDWPKIAYFTYLT